jgi:LPXTG-site transpeptidase (sortase) family protein
MDTTNFLATFFVVFGLSFGLWSIAGTISGSSDSSGHSSSNINGSDDKKETEADVMPSLSYPHRIVISKIEVDQPIVNPEDRDPTVLDQYLLKGVVRYPDSGFLGGEKNMFLFGHSTGFRSVQNPAFKAFNRLGELRVGDEIIVMSLDEAFIYRVSSSKKVDADEALVEFRNDKKLILSTCDTFGRKQDRFVVEADFVRSYKLSGQN